MLANNLSLDEEDAVQAELLQLEVEEASASLYLSYPYTYLRTRRTLGASRSHYPQLQTPNRQQGWKWRSLSTRKVSGSEKPYQHDDDDLSISVSILLL